MLEDDKGCSIPSLANIHKNRIVEGGLSCAEVTFRTEAAEESIRLMTEQFPEMHFRRNDIDNGTKPNISYQRTGGCSSFAVNPGIKKFIVSPGFDPEIVDYCLEKNSCFSQAASPIVWSELTLGSEKGS